MNKRCEGFSLIELLAVVAIVLILVALTVPNLVASRQASNEASAIASLRTLHSAHSQYLTAHSGDGQTYSDFQHLVDQKMIDSTLGSGAKSGYAFTIQTIDARRFLLSAHPLSTFSVYSGTRRFGCMDDGVIRASTDDIGSQFDTTTINTAEPIH